MPLPTTGYATATAANPAAALSDFSLLIDLSRLPASWWAEVDTSDATKGRAAIDASETELPVDWIAFDEVGQTGWARVRWSGELGAGGAHVLRVYPPRQANSSYGASSALGAHNAYDSHWWGYWPLASDGADRTSAERDLGASGGVSFGGVTGPAGAATGFDGADDYLSLSAQPNPAEMTAVVVAKPASLAADQRAMGVFSSSSSSDQSWTVWADAGGGGQGWAALARWNGGADDRLIGAGSDNASAGSWQHVALVLSESSGLIAVRVGGAAGDSGALGGTQQPPSVDFTIGGWHAASGPSELFAGALQHVHVHEVVRSNEWLDHDQAQTLDQAAFWGSWQWNEPSGGGPSVETPCLLAAGACWGSGAESGALFVPGCVAGQLVTQAEGAA